MNTVFIYVVKFVEVMLVGCVFTPSNWSECARINQWMSPYIKDFQEFQAKPPYSEEEKKWREYHTGVQAAEEDSDTQR